MNWLHAGWMLLGIGAVYVLTSYAYLRDLRDGMCVAFIGYALGNVGLWMDARGISFSDIYRWVIR